MLNRDIELLAPVGSKESLFAAVENGANAVYLGGKLFSARQFANNFDREELKEAVKYAHIRDVKVYITVNILIDNNEMKETLEYIKYLYEIDVDGIIVQDLGLAWTVAKVLPDFELHGSTQMTINNLPGAKYLENLGFKRVVLARETPLKEISDIHKGSNIELEGFVHGALCMSYSGQCLMSSIFGGRSGNRGKCAQPCRMPYSIVDSDTNSIAFDKFNKKHILSTRDLNTLDNIEEIVDSGIISLKIEGRMKRPEYVATVVKAYRKVLDEGPESIKESDKEDILQIFNRRFTKGLMIGSFGDDFVSYDRPDNRGILIGKVIGTYGDYADIELNRDVDEGDGIALQTTRGDYVGINLDFPSRKGDIIKVESNANISQNSKVYRTASSKLLGKAKDSYEAKHLRYPISMEVNIEIDSPAELIIKYRDESYKVKSDFVVEESKNVALTEEKIIEQLEKLNDTAYYIEDIKVNLQEGSFMPISQINGLRRDGIEIIDNMFGNFNRRNLITDEEFNIKVNKYFKKDRVKKRNQKLISVSVLKYNQFKQLDLNKLDRIYIGFLDNIEEAILECKKQGIEIYLLTDKIMYGKDLNRLEEEIEGVKELIDGISASNLGTLQFIKNKFDVKIHGDIGLNVFNSLTVKALEDSGVESLTLSPELNLDQIGIICNDSPNIYETIGYGYLPLMVTKHCPMSIVKGCKDDLNCETCPYSSGYELKDRKNMKFNMERKNGHTIIYNSVALMVLDNLDQIYNKGVDMIRLDFTFEKENIKAIQEVYYDYANGFIDDEEAKSFIDKYRYENDITRGHYFRGVI